MTDQSTKEKPCFEVRTGYYQMLNIVREGEQPKEEDRIGWHDDPKGGVFGLVDTKHNELLSMSFDKRTLNRVAHLPTHGKQSSESLIKIATAILKH